MDWKYGLQYNVMALITSECALNGPNHLVHQVILLMIYVHKSENVKPVGFFLRFRCQSAKG